MKNTRRFGKVRTQEEYLIYCRLEKAFKQNKRKKRRGKKYKKGVNAVEKHWDGSRDDGH